VPAYEQIRKERMRAQAEQLAVDAAVAMRVTDPDGYFAAARQRAERELAHQSRGLFPSLHRKHHR
jgi:hypothetical protein